VQDALQLSNDFPGRDLASECLAILNLDSSKISETQRAELERKLEKAPNDPVLLSRIAHSYLKEGATDKAAVAFEKALARNPNSVAILLNLASLNAGPLKQPTKALEYARSARRIAPESAEAARTLGHLALRTGDYKWARDLLDESSRTYSLDPEIWLDLAIAHFSLGQITEASTSLQKIRAGTRDFERTNEIKQLQACVQIIQQPETALTSAAFIEDGLARTPGSHPFLAAAAFLDEQRGNYAAARDRWESLLKYLPDFTPAFRQLALLSFERLNDPRRAYPFAVKAREAFRQDTAVAKVLGILVYQRADYSRAATLLAERVATQPDDGEALFYLGMAHYQLKQRDLAKTELTKALGMKLPPALANECKKTLEGMK
jgi:tetratricopeptide (TPR) repeat protein